MAKLHQALKSPFKTLKEFIYLESASGILLFTFAVLALLLSNSWFAHIYYTFVHFPLGITVYHWQVQAPLNLWINDGLMTFFFLLVGLEIKREIAIGELNQIRKLVLPIIGAIGGMLIPAAIYLLINWHHHDVLRGWAIPMATDIAFSLAILRLIGSRIPSSLKIFLIALAIFDDIGAIIIIATFYTSTINWLALLLSAICFVGLISLNRLKVSYLSPYFGIGFILWICLFYSGVHPTLAGVLIALTIPVFNSKTQTSPLKLLEHKLHPWVAIFILPLFGFTNAGISFKQVNVDHLFSSLPIGILLGLFLGKQIGIMGSTWLAIKSKIATLPANVTWQMLYGCALICGVGFTMSLFIGDLALSNLSEETIYLVRFGIFTGSFLSGLVGYLLLRFR